MSNLGDWSLFNILQLAGVWAAAIATYYAAVTALKIASDQYRVNLKVDVKRAFSVGNLPDWEGIVIGVTNIGMREIVLTEVAWQHHFLGNRRAMHIPNHRMDHARLPCKLAFSEQTSFYIDRFGSKDSE